MYALNNATKSPFRRVYIVNQTKIASGTAIEVISHEGGTRR
jgi:hypothetical protein